MRRLTYAPKAWIFIRARNKQNQIFDISDFVVEGSVNRVVNDVSKATVVLRNSFFQFSPEGQDSFFLPMDGITIWLQRLKNKPIQVFTGYLDSVPYYQMYPGNCQITASCTLKRLENTYFDPSINATTQFFQAYGWQNLGNGSYVNKAGLIPTQDSDGLTSGQNRNLAQPLFNDNGQFNPVTDSGLGAVLKPFLVQIAGWDPNHVHVSDLPSDLPAKATKLYNNVAAENLSMLDGLETVLKGFMTISADPNVSGTTTLPNLQIVNDIYKSASNKNVDPTTVVLASLVLSGLDTSFVGADGSAGLFAEPNASKSTKANTVNNPGLGPFDTEDFFANPHYNAGGKNYGGKTAAEILNPATATEIFANKMISVDKDKAFAKAVQIKGGNLLAMTEWIAKAAGVEVQSIAAKAANSYSTAKRLVGTYTGAVVGDGNPLLTGSAANQLPPGLSWGDTSKMFHADTYNDKPIFDGHYKKANDSLAPFAYVAHASGLVLVVPPKQVASRSDIIVLQDPTPKQEKSSKIKQFFDWAKLQGGASIVRYSPAGKKASTDAPGFVGSNVEYHNGLEVQTSQQQTDWPDGYVYVQVPKNAPYPAWTGNPATDNNQSNAVPPDTTTTPNSPSTQPFTFEDVAKIGLSAAFYAQADFPGDSTLSNLLRGDKALMNDIPVMEGVKQFCGGSMRSFMSLPNGDFCAFYPDYFGASNRKPYWALTDIETIDMGIQLSDQALATHVYVTGSLANPASGQITAIKDAVNTLGVVTLQHVFGDGNFIAGDIKGNRSGDIVGREMEAYQFMKFYGARPYSIQQPLIRNPIFEFLYAWQLFMFLWAKQFQTRCEFTFQPELMAGGRVAFPDHGLEFYIDSVTHNFSYENGFTTSAVLMAPSTTVKDPNNPNFMPGMALAGSGLSGFGGAPA